MAGPFHVLPQFQKFVTVEEDKIKTGIAAVRAILVAKFPNTGDPLFVNHYNMTAVLTHGATIGDGKDTDCIPGFVAFVNDEGGKLGGPASKEDGLRAWTYVLFGDQARQTGTDSAGMPTADAQKRAAIKDLEQKIAAEQRLLDGGYALNVKPGDVLMGVVTTMDGAQIRAAKQADIEAMKAQLAELKAS